MKYYYNEAENSFAIYTNFVPKPKPKGYREITKEEYEELQEQLAEAQPENIQEAE